MKKHHFFNMYLTTAVSVTLVLLVVGLLSMLLCVSNEKLRMAREEMQMTVVLNDSAQAQQKQHLMEQLAAKPYIKLVQYVSREEALQNYRETLGEDPMESLPVNPLSDCYILHLNSDYADSTHVRQVDQMLRTSAIVTDVVYQMSLIQEVERNLNLLTYILLGIVLLMMIISVVLMNNTIRLAVYSKRFLIRTMQLVGARPWTIRRPFVVRNIIMGGISAVVALGLLFGAGYYVQKEWGLIDIFSETQMLLITSGVVLGVGIILTALASYVAVGRYIRMKTNDLYYI